jgi:hypothetical protein
MAVRTRPCPPAAFRRLVRPLIGLPVSRLWQSFEWTLFLELGRLAWTPSPPPLKRWKRGSWRGERSVMLDQGWRIEREDGIVADSRSGATAIRRALRSLRGRRLEAVDIEGRLPELSLRLSGNLWVRSLSAACEATEWALFLADTPEASHWIAPKGRGLVQETGFRAPGERSTRR